MRDAAQLLIMVWRQGPTGPAVPHGARPTGPTAGDAHHDEEAPVPDTERTTRTTTAPSRLPPTLRPRPASAPREELRTRVGDDPVVDCAVYVGGERQDVEPARALAVARERGGFVWLGLHKPTEDELTAIAAHYGLHPLAVEDAVYAHQRPKLERYDDQLFMVLKTARYVEHEELTPPARW